MGFDYMKWQTDLIKDIRFGDFRDDLDYPLHMDEFVFSETDMPIIKIRGRGEPDFSKANQSSLLYQFTKIKDQCNCIVEIGVSRSRNFEETSTSILLNNKNKDCLYLGVDIEDKTYLNSDDSNIHTIQIGSEHISDVLNKLKDLGHTKIDFLFIDGWHSINQVMQEWEYTSILSDHGIVGFHDTAYHPGPYFFINNLDTEKWSTITNQCFNLSDDYGIGFAWKKH
jgi:predicted O-methyltransferase YrrM